VKDAIPHWRGGYVETNAARTMTDLLSVVPTSDGTAASAHARPPHPIPANRMSGLATGADMAPRESDRPS